MNNSIYLIKMWNVEKREIMLVDVGEYRQNEW